MTLHAAGTSCQCCVGPTQIGRRAALLGAGGLLAATAFASAARAQSELSPAAALKMLMDGNERFVAKHLTSFQEDLDILQQNTVAKQEPFAAVLACADSRVPVELIFDQSIGHVFVTRVAGNIASAEIIASLEYGAAVLGTRTILVLAHSGCGAVKAAMAGKAVPGQISTLYRFIRPAIDRADGDLTVAEKVNATIQAGLLRDASPVLSDLVKEGKLSIAAAFYDLGTGRATLLT
ncbi:carbonic anhydrase [Acidisoma sp. L85]|uniref:carbonic anhydrase n=1 Tax=Acidisoma sp. L85 TaxID=1641850 RepID=UPI00131B67D2|nr:carbonic anhydrase [Acidisoma sp. L85]